MKFRCASNAAIKKCQNRKKKIKSQEKNSTFFPKYFQQNRLFLKKYRILENIRYIFRFWRFLPSF